MKNADGSSSVSLFLVAAAFGACEAEKTAQLVIDPDNISDRMFDSTGRQNRGYKLSEKAYVDTDLPLSDFFNEPFTISARFMPEYTSCSYGPIFAENGGGYFVVGLGDYREGNGGALLAGDPVLYMKVSQKHAFFQAPGLVKRGWNHIAVVRTAVLRDGTFEFQLYLNGERLYPIGPRTIGEPLEDLSFGESEPLEPEQAPKGFLRFGRRTSQNQTSGKVWQYHGMLDDVAVYRGERSPAAVAELAEGGRLTGEEPNLIAGWSFDDFTPDAFERFPPVVTRPLTDSGPAYRIPLSWPVVDATDAAQFDNPFLIAPTETVFRLPFPVNEVWRVSQGYDVPGGSHNGYAAFSYDFVKVSSPVPGPAIVSASASGKIVHVNETVDNDPEKPLEPYVVVIENGALEYSTYLHLALESWTKVFLKGEPLLNGPTQDDLERAVPVEQGDNLAEVGPNGKHLHYDTFSHLGLGGNFPSAFEAYYMSEDEGKTWTYVSRGIPQTGQWLRHDP